MQRLFSVEHVKGTLLIFEGQKLYNVVCPFYCLPPQKYVLDLDYIATTYIHINKSKLSFLCLFLQKRISPIKVSGSNKVGDLLTSHENSQS